MQPHSILTAKFLRLLAYEESLLRDALTHAASLHAALRRGDLASAQNFATQQEALAAALRAGATECGDSANVLAKEVGLTGEEVTLSTLAKILPEPLAAEVRAVRDRLASLATELAAIQTRNANLIGHLRSYFRGVLSGLTPSDGPVRYGPGGRLDSAAGVAILANG